MVEHVEERLHVRREPRFRTPRHGSGAVPGDGARTVGESLRQLEVLDGANLLGGGAHGPAAGAMGADVPALGMPGVAGCSLTGLGVAWPFGGSGGGDR